MKIALRNSLAIACLLLISSCVPLNSVAASDHAPSRPNIIYINVDDLGWRDFGCQGSEFYETPHIDKLAAQGMRFTDAYAPASNCAPSRACCLTGQYTPRHGVFTVDTSERGKSKHRKLIPTKNTLFIEEDNLTIASLLRSSGYRTCSVGKWHISNDPTLNGFDINIAGFHRGGPYNGGYFSPFDYPNCKATEPGENLTDRLTSEAISFIEDCDGEPFFLYLPYYAVHSPLQAKADKKEKYKAKEKTKAHANATYAAMVETVDDNVGRLLARLEELSLAENTLVLLSSDNGGVWSTSKQWPLRAGKGSYYEGGIRVPLIVRWPGKVPVGATCATPVAGVDFFPTFAAAAEVTVPAGKSLDGENLLPLLTRERELAERPLFWHFPIYLQGYVKSGPYETGDNYFRTRPGSVVRLGNWKLHEYFEDGHLELYDLSTDIGEKNNLVEQESEKATEMLQILRDWREATDAPVPTKLNPKYEG